MALPLSTAQTEVWLAQQLAPTATLFNIGGYAEIAGALDSEVFTAAVRRALQEAGSPLSRFRETGSGVEQLPGDARQVRILSLDLSGEADPHAAAMAWMAADLAKPFDLAEGPLCRFALLKVRDDGVIWYTAFHHLVTDYLGARVFEQRTAELYGAAMSGRAAPAGTLTPWPEVLCGELEYRDSDTFLKDRGYWNERLRNRPEPATLSGLAPARPAAVLSSHSCVPDATMARLETLSAAAGASLVATLFAAAAIYLWRLTAERDLILGMPVDARTGRSRRSTGFLSNVIPLRLTVDPNGSVAELIRHCSLRIREAFRHRRYPSSALRSDLGVAPKEPNIHGLMLNFLPDGAPSYFGGRPARTRAFVQSAGVQDFNITLHARSDHSDAAVQFDANAANYDRAALEAHGRNFLSLLEVLSGRPETPLWQLPLMDDRERQRILGVSSGGELASDSRTALELFEAQVQRTPQAPAVVHGERCLTYGELAARASQWARRLLEAGAGRERIVAIWADRSIETVIAVLAVWKAGAAYLPLDPTHPVERVRMMLSQARPVRLLSSKASAEEARASCGLGSADESAPGLLEQLSVDLAEPIAGDVSAPVAPAGRLDDAAYVIYTSGSTGTPKGVVVRQAGLTALAAAHATHLGVTAQSRVLQLASLTFDVSVAEMLTALTQGAALVLVAAEGLGGEALQELLVKQRVTHALMTPAVLATLRRTRELVLQCLVVGGEVCSPALIEEWSTGLRMINAYGPSESTVCATLSEPLRSGEPVSIGRPIPGTRVYVLDASREPVPRGVAGELYIGGVGLAAGYLNRPALTAERFIADPYGPPGSRIYRSGDRVRWREDGALEYLGRVDEQVKIRGQRVEPGEIEAQLCARADIAQAAVVAREDAGTVGKFLVAYVVARAGSTIEPAQLGRALAERLPQPMVPAHFMVLDALPLTLNGKLDRRALPALPEPSQAFRRRPQTRTEVRLAAIWSEVLQAPHIGRGDEFFALGGQSLLALQVVARIRDVFGLELPLKELFEQPTLQTLAAHIDRALAGGTTQSVSPVVPVQWSGPAPLSYSQERMWLIQSLDPANTAYNMGVALWLRGELDVAAVCSSFDELIARHEVLRSRVQLVNEQPRQVVEPARPGMLPFTDLRSHSDAASEALRRANANLRGTFDLGSGPVFRAQLLQTAEQTFLLALALHHIAGDQWSMGVFGRELMALYNRRRRGQSGGLEPLPIGYRDFAQWERSGGRASQIEGQLRFWRGALADLPVVDLPVDRPRPKLWTMNGSSHQRQIPQRLLTAIAAVARNSGSTLFMAFLAGYAALLQRFSGQSDLPIGVPVANRTLSTVEGLVGAFVNTVIIRADVHGDPTFGELLARVRRTALDVFANQDVSFDRLVRELAQRSDPSRAPLAQVMFNVANAPMHGFQLDGVSWEQAVLDRGGAQFELSFTVDTELTHSLTVEYNTDLFERDTIERLTDQYLALLQSAVSAPDTRVSRLAILPAGQWALLQRWNDTSAPVPAATFPALFAAQAARSTNRVAVSFDGHELTYGTLDARATALADVLRRCGARRGERVAVLVGRSPELLVSLLAVQMSGSAYVPLDPDFPAERLKHMLTDSGARVLLTSGPLPQGLTVPEHVAVIDPATAFAASRQELTDGPMPQDAAYVLYTSGSTGRPKGVVVSHGALVNFLQSMRASPGLGEPDVVAAVTTVSFDIAGLELYLPLLVGARIELVAREVASDGAALGQLLSSAGITLMQATPATWRLLIDAGWRGSVRLRALCGGEALSRNLADEILDRVAELWNLYGPTETTIWSTVERVERSSQAISIGRPIANTRIHVLDDSGAVAPIGVVGEICIAGAGVAAGYHGLPALTAERFIADSHSGVPGSRLYRTGDLGRWGADGKLYHAGRSDHQVKLRGFRIELEEIEHALTSHSAVRQAVAAVREAGLEDPRLVAYVVLEEREEVTVGDIRSHLRSLLPQYMVPSVVMPLLTLPLSPNGKLDRAALPDPFAAAARQEGSRESPQGDLERLLAEIWLSVLRVEHVARSDNFFELGGYSLLALRVSHEIERRTGRRLDPRALFFHDLREVAEMLERDPAAGSHAR
jgi:nonribosomal peptide synthetase DhbF